MTGAGTPSLFDPDPRAAEDRAFDAEHPGVYALFRRLAERLRRRGVRRFSARMIVGQMRWRHALAGRDGPFRINDHRAEQLARRLVRDLPEFATFFEFRRSRFDQEAA